MKRLGLELSVKHSLASPFQVSSCSRKEAVRLELTSCQKDKKEITAKYWSWRLEMLELMNVYRLNTLHANSDTRAKGLLHLVSETSGCRLEYNLSPQGQRFALRRCPDSKINTGLLLHIYGLCTPFFYLHWLF